MAAVLVTLDQVKNHLRIPSFVADPGDSDLQLKLDAAEAAVLDYCGASAYWRPIVDAWTTDTVPAYVRAAILLQTGELWRFRGDDLDGEGPNRTDGDLSPVVRDLLRRTRDPVLQ